MTKRPTYDELERRVKELEGELTESEREKKTLSRSERNFRNVIESAQEGLLITQNTKIVFTNNRACEFMGCSKEELCGRAFVDYVHPDDREWLFDQYLKKLAGEDVPLGQSYRVLGGEGRPRWVQSRSTQIEWCNQPALLSSLIDVTDVKVAEERLRGSERKYRHLIENTKDVIYSLDTQGRFTYVSPYVRILTGYTSDEVIGHSFLEFIHPDELPFIKERFKGVLNGATLSSDYRIVDKNRNVRWVYSSTGPTIENDKVVALQGILTDISERKQAEEALRASEERFFSLFEHTSSGVAIYESVDNGKDFVFRALNPAAEQITRISQSDALGNRLLKLFPRMDKSGLLEALQRVWETGREEHLLPFYYKDEIREGWRENRLFKLPTGEVVALFNDVTNQKKAEEALRESEEKYRNLVEESFDGIFIQRGPNIIFANKRLNEMLGYDDGELIGQNYWLLYHTDYQKLTRAREKARMRQEKVVNRYEVKLQRKDGSCFFGEINARAIIFPTDKEIGIQVWVKDIDERKRAEEALKESEEKFRLISEQSLMAIVIVQDDRIKYANQAYLQLTGYTSEEIRNWTMVDVVQTIYPEDRDFVMEQGRKKAAGVKDGVVTNYSYRGITKSGEVRWIDQYSKTISYEGKPANFLTFIDINDQKVAQETLVQSEKRYRDLADSLPQTVFETDEHGKLTFVNRNAFDIFGYSQTDFERGMNAIEMLIPEDREKALEAMLIMKHGKTTGYNEYTALKKDGTTFPISIHANALIHESDFKGFRGILIDLTQAKKAEESLRESEEKFRRIFENIQDAYYESSLDGTILEISPSIQNMSQYKREELIGMSLYDIYTNPKEREEFLKLIVDRGKVNEFEVSLTDKDGSIHSCSISTLLMKDDQGNPIKLVGSVRDISERKQSEEKRKKLEAQLHRAQKMEALGLLAGGVAHDLNNILSGIVNYPELLLMDLPEDSPLRRPIKTIQESGLRAVDVVADLLTLARGVAAGKEVLNLNVIVKEYLESPEHKKLEMSQAFVDFKTELDLKLLNMSGSPSHIRKTLMNLVINAAEAIEGSGTVTISTNSQYLDEPLRGYENVRQGEYVVLSVSDQGSGISPEDFERIFEPFYTKKVMGRSGTGLGLAIVWSTVQDHNGYINVKSNEKGTVFEVYFPVTREKIDDGNEAPSLEDYIGHGEKILVVDDEERQREILEVILTKLGYVTEAVASGEEAIRYVKEYPVAQSESHFNLHSGSDLVYA
jgi:PAS domain S-box-containing protein